MLGVVKDVPVPKEAPPVNALYQLIVPALAVAPNDKVPVPHLLAGVVPVIVGVLLIVKIADEEGVPDEQLPPETTQRY
jgi:hypothetical protein